MEYANFHRIFERLVFLFNTCDTFLRKNESTKKMVHDIATNIVSKEMMASIVVKFQSYISIVIDERLID